MLELNRNEPGPQKGCFHFGRAHSCVGSGYSLQVLPCRKHEGCFYTVRAFRCYPSRIKKANPPYENNFSSIATVPGEENPSFSLSPIPSTQKELILICNKNALRIERIISP